MNENMIRDAEWSHLMHPADAKALQKLRSDDTLFTLKALSVCGLIMIGAVLFSVWLLL